MFTNLLFLLCIGNCVCLKYTLHTYCQTFSLSFHYRNTVLYLLSIVCVCLFVLVCRFFMSFFVGMVSSLMLYVLYRFNFHCNIYILLLSLYFFAYTYYCTNNETVDIHVFLFTFFVENPLCYYYMHVVHSLSLILYLKKLKKIEPEPLCGCG